jgi:hypothetical protein
MRGAISHLPKYAFMTWCLVKHRDNFTFLPFVVVDFVIDSDRKLLDTPSYYEEISCF